MGTGNRLLWACCLLVAVVTGSVGLALDGDAGAGTSKRAPEWSAGDCFAEADVDRDEVDLATKVSCTKPHAVQVMGGSPLPERLASAGLPALLDPSSPLRPALAIQASITCNAGNILPNIYPRLGASLARLVLSEDVTELVPSTPGRNGWVLPDAKSFAAGTTDLLCIFEPDPSVKGANKADVRKLETKATLPTQRLCWDFKADDSGADITSCAKKHDKEQLVGISLLTGTAPADVNTWTDADWAPFDASCAKFAAVLIGAERKDLIIRAETDPAIGGPMSRRFFYCHAYTVDETLQLPPGTLVGLGSAKLELPKD